MIRTTASGVERQLACPGSAHLPQTEYSSKWADQGDARHEDAEVAALLGGELPWQVQKLLEPGDCFEPEFAMAYDVSDDTARSLGNIQWRDYQGLRPFDIPMTIDLIIRGERRICVVDYKGHARVTPAAINPQLATAALAAARAYGYDEVTVAIVYLGASWLPADVATLGVFELDMHAARLREMVASSDRSLHVGPHCEFCHAFLSCPEQARLAKEAGGGELAVRVETMIPFDSDDDAADAYELRQRIKTLLTRIDAALYARAAERPIPLRNGRMFGRIEKQGNEKLDGNVVWTAVKELTASAELADECVTRTATKKRLSDNLKPKVVERVLELVRLRGGSERKAGYEITEYDATGPRLVTDGEPQQMPETVEAPS